LVLHSPMHLILYSKSGCHLCEALLEKLEKIESIDLTLEVRDIVQNREWLNTYQYEVPVLYLSKEDEHIQLPRTSPRLNITQLEQFLTKYL